MVQEAVLCAVLLLILSQDVTINSGKGRLRIDISGAPEDRFYQLKSVKRLLPSVVVKVRGTPWLTQLLLNPSQGLPNVTRAVINIKEKDDERGRKGQKELIVEGTGLKQVMTTMGVVGEQTISNHVTEVEQVLGIEAARRTIINEIQFTMSGHGIYVDPRHCMLLGDVMTYKVRRRCQRPLSLISRFSIGTSTWHHTVWCLKDEGQRAHAGFIRENH